MKKLHSYDMTGKNREQTAKELTSYLMHKHYQENDIDAIIDTFGENFLWLGAGEEEFAAGTRKVKDIFRQFRGKVMKCSISDEEYETAMITPEVCLCMGRMWVATDPETQVFLRVHQRISTLFKWVEGKPYCCHIHLSNPYVEMVEGDVGFPTKMARQSYDYMQSFIEEQKRQAVERLKQQEQEAWTGYEQAKAMREHKTAELEATEHELKAVKGELKTEKLKSAAAEVGSNIVEGIGSLVGTSKVKRQEQQIGALRQEVAAHEETIEILQTQMQTMQTDYSRRLLEVQRQSQQTIGKQQGEIDRIYDWFPDTPRLIKWGEYCRSLGFSDGQVRDLVNMRPVRFSGELYSHEHSQHFEVENSEARLMRDEKGPGGFQLFIDRIPILRWFRQKAKEFLEHIGIKIKDRKQDRGMGMR